MERNNSSSSKVCKQQNRKVMKRKHHNSTGMLGKWFGGTNSDTTMRCSIGSGWIHRCRNVWGTNLKSPVSCLGNVGTI